LLQGNAYSKLRLWGLAIQKPNLEDPSKNQSGWWKPSDKGCAFAFCKTAVHSGIFTFNGEVVGHTDKFITWREALGVKFDYREVLKVPLEELGGLKR
jgi:hypothetical protein